MDTTGTDLLGRRRRRRHSGEFKETVIRECMVAGVSIASVALRHGLNANMLRKWVIEGKRSITRVLACCSPQATSANQPTFRSIRQGSNAA